MEIWLRVNCFVLLRNKYASILREMSYGSSYILPELSRFLFYRIRYFPSLNYCPGKKKIDIVWP